MRLHRIQEHFGERFALVTKAYPLFVDDLPGRWTSPHGIVSRLRAGLEAERDGAPWRPWPEGKPIPRSSLPALAAAKCARLQGPEAFRHFDLALYQAYFVDCRDISQTDTLVEIAEAVGLERAPFLAALESTDAVRQVLADHEEYRQRFGMASPGIPFLEVEGRPIVGAVPFEVYAGAIREGLRDKAQHEPPDDSALTREEQVVETSTSAEYLDLRRQLVFLWEETTWKAAVYAARSRAALREGHPQVGELLAEAATREGRYASILSEVLFAEYVQDTPYNVEQTVQREADPGGQPQLIALADGMGLEPVTKLLDQLFASRLAMAKRLRDVWARSAGSDPLAAG